MGEWILTPNSYLVEIQMDPSADLVGVGPWMLLSSNRTVLATSGQFHDQLNGEDPCELYYANFRETLSVKYPSIV